MAAAVFANSFTFNLSSNGPGEAFSVDGTTVLRLLLCAGCGLYGLLFLPYNMQQLFRFPGAIATLFGFWTLFTIPLAENLAYSAAACFALWCMILFSPAVISQLGGRRIAVWTLIGLTIYCLGSWFYFFAWPELGRFNVEQNRLGTNSNELAIQIIWAANMLLVLGSAQRLERRTLSLLAVLMAVSLYQTGSRTPLLAAVAVLTLFFVRKVRIRTIVAVTFSVIITAALGVMLLSTGTLELDPDAMASKFSRSGQAQEVYDFTGRPAIWAYALEKIQQAPWLGYGHGASRQALSAFKHSSYGVNDLDHAHNLLLNVTLCTGVAGGLLVAFMLFAQLRALVRKPALFPDLALVTVLVGGLMEPILFGPMPRGSTIIWLIALFWRQMGASVEDMQPAEASVKQQPALRLGSA